MIAYNDYKRETMFSDDVQREESFSNSKEKQRDIFCVETIIVWFFVTPSYYICIVISKFK